MLKAGGPFLSHLVVPGAEDSDGMGPRRAAHPVALPKGMGHAVMNRARQGVTRAEGTEAREKTDRTLPATKTHCPLVGALLALGQPTTTPLAPPPTQLSASLCDHWPLCISPVQHSAHKGLEEGSGSFPH